MKRFLIASGLIAISIFAIVEFTSTYEYYRCEGEISRDEYIVDQFIFLEFVMYGPLVGLFSERTRDGALSIELPGEHLGYFDRVSVVGHQRQIYDSGSMRGHFSTLSYYTSLMVHDNVRTFFDGYCHAVER